MKVNDKNHFNAVLNTIFNLEPLGSDNKSKITIEFSNRTSFTISSLEDITHIENIGFYFNEDRYRKIYMYDSIVCLKKINNNNNCHL